MANEPVVPETSLITATTRKPRAKRVRPRKGSLNRAGRRTSGKSKAATPPPKTSMLNKLLNASIVVAVFVTALAIQRIVPTEQVATPKVEPVAAVETLATPETTPTQNATPATPETTSTPVAVAPESTSATTPATPVTTAQAPASTPAAAPTAQPCVTPTPQSIVDKSAAPAPRKIVARRSRRVNHDEYSGGRREDFKTSLNSGGSEDLDNPSMREHYMNTSKLAKRVVPQTPAAEAQRSEIPSANFKTH